MDVNNIAMCRKWLLLAVFALAVSGLLSISVVLLRLDVIKSLFISVSNFYDISLIMHVNLSVLVWSCSIICIIFSFVLEKPQRYASSIWYLALVATLMMIASIFMPGTLAIKNNYIPMLNNNPLFSVSLSLFLFSILLYALLTTKSCQLDQASMGVYGIAIIIFSACLSFFFAYRTIPVNLNVVDPMQFYEYLFWGGGHILQFAFSQALFLVYVIMLGIPQNKWIVIIIGVNTLAALLAPLIYLAYPADSPELLSFFTLHMRTGGAIIPVAIIAITAWHFKSVLKAENHVLLLSTGLFIYGGVLGLLAIQGNVTVPAHYHGSIVGMTIAFMGFIYWLLPHLKLGKVPNLLANIQLYIYGIGQFCHITGLEWLGGYGALRKVASLPESSSILFPRTLFAVGGMMAVLGGFMFAIIVVRHVVKSWSSLTVVKITWLTFFPFFIFLTCVQVLTS